MFTKRSLRSKSHTVSYDDEQLGRKYDILERLGDPKLSNQLDYVREMQPGELTLQFVQEHGLTQPLVFHTCEGLGMKLPPKGFSVQDVKKRVGARRVVDVIDCNTQESLTMSLGAWVRFYRSHQRERTLNVISLEFSHTNMDHMVEPPSIVKQLDWVELVWPRSLRDQQTDPTNDISKMKYPKVQKYCLMSVAGCYTDFHLDFGGTSVWYHVFEGEKTFLLIPPTPQNYQAFQVWQKSGQQDAVFFPDTVLACQMVHLRAGDTFFLPTGWIHAVYTPKDSLVFGGNFLHTRNIPAQLKVKEMEDILKVPEKFRFPFYSQIHWYVLTAYSNRLQELGVGSESERPSHKATTTTALPYAETPEYCRPYFPRSEVDGLSYLLLRVCRDQLFMEDVPSCVQSAAALLCRLEEQLCCLDQSTAFSRVPNGVAVITSSLAYQQPLPSPSDVDNTSPSFLRDHPQEQTPPEGSSSDMQESSSAMEESGGVKVSSGAMEESGGVKESSKVTRSRRRRCLMCSACRHPPCGVCRFCLDSPKFGGSGHLKQSCVHRKCMKLLQEHYAVEAAPEAHTSSTMCIVPAEELAAFVEEPFYTVVIEAVINPYQSGNLEEEASLGAALEVLNHKCRPLSDLVQQAEDHDAQYTGNVVLAQGLEEVIMLEPQD